MADINLSAAAVAQLILSIGYAQQLNTTDKSTLVAAINEVLATAKAGGSPAADKVTYSGEIDGTTVANVKAALDALTARKTGASTASEVSYSGKIGAGEVDNVKQALDALAYGNPLDMSADFNDAQIGGPEEWPTQADENDSTKYRIPAGEYLITASNTEMLYYRVMDTGTMRTVLLLDLSGSQDYSIELFQSAAPGEYTPMLKCEFDEQGRVDFYGYATFNGVNKWEQFPKLPDPTNNSGKWLKSDGETASWENLPSSSTPSAEDVTVAGGIGDAGSAPNTVTNVAQALEALSFSQPLNLTANFTNSGASSVAEWASAGSGGYYNIGEGYYVIGADDTRYYVRILGVSAMAQRVVQIWKHGRVNIEPSFEVWQCTSPGSAPEMLLRYEAERGDLTIPNQRWDWQVPDYRDAKAEQVLMAPGDGRAPVWGNAPKPVFMVTATVSGATASFDKTLVEISEAYSAGNVVQATIANGDRAGAVLDLAICVPSTLAMFSTTIDMNTSILNLQVGITTAGAGFYEKSLSTEGLPAITAADKNKVLVAGDDGAEWGNPIPQWYSIAEQTLTEETNSIIITQDSEGNAISDYNASMMMCMLDFPADGTQTSTNGSVWVFPVAEYGSAFRDIVTVATWKTIHRTQNILWVTSQQTMMDFASGVKANIGNISTEIPPMSIKAFRADIPTAGDHFPVGTLIRVTVFGVKP